jgi:hypothetical protein
LRLPNMLSADLARLFPTTDPTMGEYVLGKPSVRFGLVPTRTKHCLSSIPTSHPQYTHSSSYLPPARSLPTPLAWFRLPCNRDCSCRYVP